MGVGSRFGLNLSRVVGLAALIPASIAWHGRRRLPLFLLYVLWHGAASGAAVSLCSTDRLSRLTTGALGKRPRSGRLGPCALLLWPYHAALRVKLLVGSVLSEEPTASRVLPGLYVGGWPGREGWADAGAGPLVGSSSSPRGTPEAKPSSPAPQAVSPLPSRFSRSVPPRARGRARRRGEGGALARPRLIVDATCELPRVVPSAEYLCVPLWDTHAPTVPEMNRAVEAVLAALPSESAPADGAPAVAWPAELRLPLNPLETLFAGLGTALGLHQETKKDAPTSAGLPLLSPAAGEEAKKETAAGEEARNGSAAGKEAKKGTAAGSTPPSSVSDPSADSSDPPLSAPWVLVHCAHGHGRSVAIVTAAVLAHGNADTVDAAEAHVRRARPRARLNARQRAAVEAWWAQWKKAN